jgi:hypothetical protein
MKMTQHEREQWIRGEFGTVSDSDWLPLISAWKNEDGSLTIIANTRLITGNKYRLYPKNKTAPEQAPDYSCTVKRDRVKLLEEGVEILAKKGNEL